MLQKYQVCNSSLCGSRIVLLTHPLISLNILSNGKLTNHGIALGCCKVGFFPFQNYTDSIFRTNISLFVET